MVEVIVRRRFIGVNAALAVPAPAGFAIARNVLKS
jgi:hypothetical protein